MHEDDSIFLHETESQMHKDQVHLRGSDAGHETAISGRPLDFAGLLAIYPVRGNSRRQRSDRWLLPRTHAFWVARKCGRRSPSPLSEEARRALSPLPCWPPADIRSFSSTKNLPGKNPAAAHASGPRAISVSWRSASRAQLNPALRVDQPLRAAAPISSALPAGHVLPLRSEWTTAGAGPQSRDPRRDDTGVLTHTRELSIIVEKKALRARKNGCGPG